MRESQVMHSISSDVKKNSMAAFCGPRLRTLRFSGATVAYMAGALALGFFVPQVNRWVFPAWASPVDKSTMTAILSAIASGMITLSGLVFSLVFVLVQFGSATYSPRITRIFAHSRVLHNSLGVFTGTFLYSLMALRTIGMEQTERVSAFTIWVAFVWLLASVLVLAGLVRIFANMTVTNVFAALGKVGRISIERVYKNQSPSRANPASGKGAAFSNSGGTVRRILYEGPAAYVTGYDEAFLIQIARNANATIYMPYAVGDAIKDGAAISLVRETGLAVSEARVYGCIEWDRERMFRNDPKYAMRLLVDTAIRALSPAVNDPTTAVQALDHIESLLRRLGNVNLHIGELTDRDGVVRVVINSALWEDYLQLGLSEIMQYGATSVQVERRLEALLIFLSQALPPDRAEAVERFREQRKSVSTKSFSDATFLRMADTPDREGIGSGNDGLVKLAQLWEKGT